MKAMVACDKFKGSLSAWEAGDAVLRGLGDDWDAVNCPVADGGEGFTETMLKAAGGTRVAVNCRDALGREVEAEYGILAGGKVAVMEMSAASGMWRIDPSERNPGRSSTFGTGQMMAHAANQSGVEEILVGLGGSATNDGGVGMAAALGWRFLDRSGNELEPVPAGLGGLDTVDGSGKVALPRVRVACDVDNPLLGSRGATAVFGPQKGAGEEERRMLEEVLERLVDRTRGREMAEHPGAGAAGGLGFGLMAFANGVLEPGFGMVAGALGLRERMAEVDLVLTGEGSLDAQSLGGKGPCGVAGLAREVGVAVVGIAGRIEDSVRGRFDALLSLEEFQLPPEQSMQRGAELVEMLVRRHEGLLKGLARG